MADTIGGKDLTTVERLLLNADQYKAELIDVAKEIRKQARETKAAELVQLEFDKATGKVEQAIKEQTAAIKKNKVGIADLKAGYDFISSALMRVAAAANEVLTRGNEINNLWKANTLNIEQAQRATAGYLSEQELLKAANKSTAFGLGFTEEQFAKLAKGAVVASQKIGGDVPKAIDDLMTGLARQSKMILDNLGIQVNATAANEAYAKQLGKTAKDLTDAEKKQAFMNAAIKDLERIAGGGEVQVNNLGAAYAVLKTSIGDAYDAFAVWVANSNSITGVLGKVTSVVQDFAAALRTVKNDSISLAQEALDIKVSELKALQSALESEGERSAWLSFSGLSKEQRAARLQSIKEQLIGLEIQREELGVQRSITSAVREQTEAYSKRFKDLVKPPDAATKTSKKTSTKPGPLAGIIGNVDKQIDSIEKGIRRAEIAYLEFYSRIEQRATAYNQWIFALREQELKNAEESRAKQMATEFAAFDAMKDKIESLGTFSLFEKLLSPNDYLELIQNIDSIGETYQNVMSDMLDGVEQVAKGVNKAIWASIAAQENLAEGLTETLNEIAQAFGQQMTWKFLEHTAAAIGALAYGNYASAGEHAIAAAAYAAAAVAAGAVASATAPSSSTTSRAASTRGLGGAAAPTTQQGTQATYVFNINALDEVNPTYSRFLADSLVSAVNSGQFDVRRLST